MCNSTKFVGIDIATAMIRVGTALISQREYLTSLDQAMGDGDLGITTSKAGEALITYATDEPSDELGKYFMKAGMKVNSAASSTMGTLLATALMQAGKEVKGCEEIDGPALVKMLNAAFQGMMDRGKAKLGDKTILDALGPAAEAFETACAEGDDLPTAGEKMVSAAEAGLAAVIPLQSRIGRASWLGERTRGLVDPGCAALVIILKAIIKG
ncbi:MAG: dihydroxyacetone kinase subunit L [Chloroflexota bacterium]|nr:dihydroxyacetone kinase subunit L [Chloroflexota bacterium]